MSLNESHQLYASEARTASVTSSDKRNLGHRGIRVVIDVTAVSATPSVTPKIEGKTATGIYYTLFEGAAITGTGKTEILVFPGYTVTEANKFLPLVWRLVLTHADADSITYSVDYDLMP